MEIANSPASVLMAGNLLNAAGTTEVGTAYVKPNSIQTVGYLEEMEMPTHYG